MWEEKLELHDSIINKCHRFDRKGFKGFTLSCNTKSKEEVDGLIAKFKKFDVKIVKEPFQTDWGYHLHL